jgi:hypothetical protein
MLSDKIKEYLNEYISQEVYVEVAVAKGKIKSQQMQQLANILKAITLQV